MRPVVNILIILIFFGPYLALAQNTVRVEDYLDEAKGLNSTSQKHINQDNVDKIYSEENRQKLRHPKEAVYPERELKAKSQRLLHGSVTERDKGNSDPGINAGAHIKESHVKRKRFDQLDREKWLQKSNKITANPLIGVESDCMLSGIEDHKVDYKPESYEVEVEELRLIETTAQCTEDGLELRECTSTRKVSCKRISNECGSGGIVLSSLASDMKFEFLGNILTVGTIADNYWNSHCDKYTRSTRFEIKNKNQIQEFRIIQVGFDDYLRVLINGNQVYNEPFGGDILEIGQWSRIKKTVNGRGYSCELSKSNNNSVNIDLLPYLHDGMNELIIEVVVSGGGEGWVQIRTRQHCCTEYEDRWEESC